MTLPSGVRWFGVILGMVTGFTLLHAESDKGPDVLCFKQGIPVVLMFHSIECPISGRYVPEIKRIAEKYGSGRGIGFYLVFPNADESETMIRRYLAEQKLVLPYLRDADGELTRLAGARVTPEVAVFLPSAAGPTLVYRGRYDDRYTELGKSRPAATTHDLEAVLATILAGGHLKFFETKAVGCYIITQNSAR